MNLQRSLSTVSRNRQAGFTLAEMLVALGVTALLLLGVLFTFDLNARIARAQGNVADMQQSLRIAQDDVVRLARMAGRGGLPLTDAAPYTLPQGVAISIRNNAGDEDLLVEGDSSTRILPGTDVLTLRGVFSTLYQANITGALFLNPPLGTLILTDPSPGGVKQDLAPLRTAIDARTHEALLLVSTLGDSSHAVVELDPGTSFYDAATVTLGFRISGSTLSDAYGRLSAGGVFPEDLKAVALAGIVEEYRYYIREEHVVTGDRNSDLAPKLARARFFPGTGQPYMGQAGNARLDLADNILDLQAALGFDSSNGGARADDLDNTGPDDQILETPDGRNDDWLLNASADPAEPVWQAPQPQPPLQYLRVTTLARSDRRDSQYQAPLLPSRLEDRAYAAGDAANSYASRMFRWRLLQTVIDLRNL